MKKYKVTLIAEERQQLSDLIAAGRAAAMLPMWSEAEPGSGLALALGNWAGLLAMLLLPGVAFGYCIAVEEVALLSTLGEPYARYMRRTWRLIPYLF